MRRFLQFAILGAAAWILAGCAPTVLAKSDDGITFDNPTDSVVTIDVLVIPRVTDHDPTSRLTKAFG